MYAGSPLLLGFNNSRGVKQNGPNCDRKTTNSKAQSYRRVFLHGSNECFNTSHIFAYPVRMTSIPSAEIGPTNEGPRVSVK
jgi:hypothetical protein